MSNHKNLDLQVADQLRDTIRQMQKDFDRLGTRVKRLEETSGQKQVNINNLSSSQAVI
jgi:hypothetical protein